MRLPLVGGSGPNEGNLMVGGQPVCDDLWSEEDANVVCRQLGYLHGQPTSNSQFGSVNTDFAMDDVQCNGDEELLWVCPFSTSHNCGGSEGAGVICSNDEGPGSGSGLEEVAVLVKSATTDGSLEGASVELIFYDDITVLTGTTDSEGVAVFTLSPGVGGQLATIVVSREGYATVTIVKEIYAGVLINIFASPDLAAGEHRIVLSWETERDVDNMFGYGPETITFTDADNDAYVYELYVNDYDGIGIANTGAHIILYGETNIELDVPTPGNGELWWVLGTFEPSVGTSP